MQEYILSLHLYRRISLVQGEHPRLCACVLDVELVVPNIEAEDAADHQEHPKGHYPHSH